METPKPDAEMISLDAFRTMVSLATAAIEEAERGAHIHMVALAMLLRARGGKMTMTIEEFNAMAGYGIFYEPSADKRSMTVMVTSPTSEVAS